MSRLAGLRQGGFAGAQVQRDADGSRGKKEKGRCENSGVLGPRCSEVRESTVATARLRASAGVGAGIGERREMAAVPVPVVGSCRWEERRVC